MNPAGPAAARPRRASTSAGSRYPRPARPADAGARRPAIVAARRGGARLERAGDGPHARRASAFPAHLALTCIFDAGGQSMGTVGVLRDLTEQVETQRRLIQREKLASLGRDGGGRGPRDPQPAGRHQDGHQPPVLAGDRRQPAVAGDGRAPSSPASREIEGIINSLLDFTRDTRLERDEYELARILDPVVEAAAAEGRARGVAVGYGRARPRRGRGRRTARSCGRSSPTS